MKPIKRMTSTTRTILAAMLHAAPEPIYPGELADLLALAPGSIYNAIYRLEEAEWVSSYWESEADAAEAGRRPRRYYRIDGGAIAAVRAAVEQPGRAWERFAPGVTTSRPRWT